MRHRDDPSRFKSVLERCHDRLCVPCGRDRLATIRANLHAYLAKRPYRFLTLTLSHTDDRLTDRLDLLHRSFRALRRTHLWQNHVEGGAAFIELARNPTTKRWHTHLHALLDGTYIDQRDLANEWQRITVTSRVIDIRYLPDAHHAADYVSKYVTKPLPASIIRDDAALDEALHALQHRRLLITFGTWRNARLTTPPPERAWTLYLYEAELRYKAANDDPLARAVLSMLNTADPITGEFTVELDADHLEHPP
jgi:hypothetical protein